MKGNDLRGVLGLKSPKFEFVYQDAQAAAVNTESAAVAADTGAQNGLDADGMTGAEMTEASAEAADTQAA